MAGGCRCGPVRLQESSRQHRLSGWLVAAEVTLSNILLIVAGLFPSNLPFPATRSARLQPGANNHLSPLAAGWKQHAFTIKSGRLSGRAGPLEKNLPSVDATGLVTSLPVSDFQMTVVSGFGIPGLLPPNQQSVAALRMTAISPDYFRAMGIPILAGRALSANDTAGAQPVGVANHALVRKYLPGVNPIGQQIVLDQSSGFVQPVTIVGVAGDVIQGNAIGEPAEPELAVSFLQLPPNAQFSQFMLWLLRNAFAVQYSFRAHDIAL